MEIKIYLKKPNYKEIFDSVSEILRDAERYRPFIKQF